MVWTRQAEIVLLFFENIAQRRGNTHARRNRKRQPHGLVFSVVGVLPENDYTGIFGRKMAQGIENVFLSRVDSRVAALERGQLPVDIGKYCGNLWCIQSVEPCRVNAGKRLLKIDHDGYGPMARP